MLENTNFKTGRYRLSSFETLMAKDEHTRISINGSIFISLTKYDSYDIEDKFFAGEIISAYYQFPEDITSLSPEPKIRVELFLEGDWVHVHKII